MPHDVFISYSSRDGQVANAVCHALEADGIRCWIAPRDALPGHKYQGSIVRAIRSCRVMVLIFSSGSNQSDHVLREVTIASEAGRLVLPFRIEDVEIGDDLYYYVSSVHWLDAITPPLKQHIDKLVSTIHGFVQPGAEPSATEEPEPTAAEAPLDIREPPARSDDALPDESEPPPSVAPGVAPNVAPRVDPAAKPEPAVAGAAPASPAPAPERSSAVPVRRSRVLVALGAVVAAFAIANAVWRTGEPVSQRSSGLVPAPADTVASPPPRATPTSNAGSRQPTGSPGETRSTGADPARLRSAVEGNWRARFRSGDTLFDFDVVRRTALAFPGSSPYGERTADAEALVSREAGPITLTSLPGDWRCRSLQINSLGWFLYPYFRCRIALEGSRLTIRKLTGSQRFHGDIYRASNDLFVVLGVSYVDDQLATQSFEQAGDGVYALEQLSTNRLRITRASGSGAEVWELIR
jgi:hypothetical protein